MKCQLELNSQNYWLRKNHKEESRTPGRLGLDTSGMGVCQLPGFSANLLRTVSDKYYICGHTLFHVEVKIG